LNISFHCFLHFFLVWTKPKTKIHKFLGESSIFSRKNSHFQGASSAVEKIFWIPALFKEFKDLHEPCKINTSFLLALGLNWVVAGARGWWSFFYIVLATALITYWDFIISYWNKCLSLSNWGLSSLTGNLMNSITESLQTTLVSLIDAPPCLLILGEFCFPFVAY